MNLHEYQGKELFSEYGLPVPKSAVIHSAEEAARISNSLSFPLVVKAQVHAGGRGKAGGVKLVKNQDELTEAVRKLLHTRLVTYQTDSHGQPINQLLIEEGCKISRELYLGAVIDRAKKRVALIASKSGGVDIETVAHEHPDQIHTIYADPLMNILPFQGRALGFKLDLKEKEINQFAKIATILGKMVVDCDLSMVEINPLVVTEEGSLICLDAKVNVDDNALFRQTKLREQRDNTQDDERELHAREWELSYIALDGDIGCMVNGAGLAMATMDLIKLHGGNPANFLDVGGGATKERVREAFKIILSDEKVKAILVNIFGGIVKCDLIAQGIIDAISDVKIKIPVVVRLEGNRAEEARELLKTSNLNITPASSLKEAADLVVKAAKGNK